MDEPTKTTVNDTASLPAWVIEQDAAYTRMMAEPDKTKRLALRREFDRRTATRPAFDLASVFDGDTGEIHDTRQPSLL